MIPIDYLFQLLVVLIPLAYVSGIVSNWLAAQSIRYARRSNLLAEVTGRSSHREPTPRVGGIGLVGGLLPGFALLAVMLAAPGAMPGVIQPVTGVEGALDLAGLGGMVAAVLLAFGLGLWDDRRDVPALWKFGGQVVIAFVAPLCGVRLREFHVPGMEDWAELPALVSVVLTAGWILLVMNAVNFMDGINGLAGRFAQFIAVGALIAPVGFGGFETMIPLAAGLWGASEGFLRHNVPEARTFMGDCGSQPLGLLVALLGVHLANLPVSYPLPFIGFVIMVSPFLWDVLFTLGKRAVEGKRLLSAHREHLYQRYLAAKGESHEAARVFVQGHLLATVIIGACYVRFFYMPEKLAGQIVLIGFAVAALGSYTVRVYLEESRSAAETE